MSFIKSLFGGAGSTKTDSNTQREVMGQALWQGKNLANLGGATTGEAKAGLGKASGTLDKSLADMGAPLDFWKGILSGDKTKVMQSMAPEVNTILSQYDTAFKTQNELSGRGGGSTAFNQNLQYKKLGDIINTLTGARKESAGKVADIATKEAGVGAAQTQIGAILGSIGAGETSSATADLSLAGGTASTRREADAKQAEATGQGIGQLLGMLLFGGG